MCHVLMRAQWKFSEKLVCEFKWLPQCNGPHEFCSTLETQLGYCYYYMHTEEIKYIETK